MHTIQIGRDVHLTAETAVFTRLPGTLQHTFFHFLARFDLREPSRFDVHVAGCARAGAAASRSFSICYLKGRELLALEAVNHSKDYMAARKLIAERACLDPEKLADVRVALKDSF